MSTSMPGEDIETGPAVKNRGPPNYAIYEERETQWISWLIPVFIVANIAMFVIVMYVNNCPKQLRERGLVGGNSNDKCVARFLGRFSFQPLSENPLLGPSASTLEKLGALERAKIVHQHQAWRLISSVWLHAGIIHLISNMLCLALIGIRLEQQCGFVRIGIVYLLSGFGGSILSSLFIQQSISVGASGALFGLLGAMLSELITNWSIYTNKVECAFMILAYSGVGIAYFQIQFVPFFLAALLTILVIVLINLAVGILPHVDNFAHIGGFLTGFLLGFVLLPRPQLGWIERRNLPADVRVKSKYKAYQYVLWLVSLVLVIAGFTVGLIMLFRGVNGYEHCHWCRYLTCVPTSKWKCDEQS